MEVRTSIVAHYDADPMDGGVHLITHDFSHERRIDTLTFPTTQRYFPEGSHVLKQPVGRMGSQGGNVNWFRFWLQGYEDPGPIGLPSNRRPSE